MPATTIQTTAAAAKTAATAATVAEMAPETAAETAARAITAAKTAAKTAAATSAASSLIFYVNGKRVEQQDPDPEWTLLWYLRTKLRLVGSKLGCGEGGCGACTVMLSSMKNNQIRHYSANACLVLVVSLHGRAVTTVEGIGSSKTRLHPIQERIAMSHGSQCGFCTPGFVMSAYALLRSQPQQRPPTMEQLEEALVGNLCRCTGYRPILEGLKTLTVEGRAGCGRADCCKLNGNKAEEPGTKDLVMSDVLVDPSDFAPYDPTQELIFPPELKLSPGIISQPLHFAGPRVSFYQVNQLQSLLSIKQQHPHAKIVGGNTEIGVEVQLKGQLYPVVVTVCGVKELEAMAQDSEGLLVGASVTLTDLQDKLKEVIAQLPAEQTRVFSAMLETLKWFAGKQIRNVASLGGNIMTCSPIGDLNPILLAARATLTFDSAANGPRSVVLDKSFFKGYRACEVAPDEVLVTVRIPFTKPNEYFASYKQARRRDDDIAIVNAAMMVSFSPGTAVVESSSLAYGGVAATTVLASDTMKSLQGQDWSNDDLLERTISCLLREIKVGPSAPGGMSSYRNALVPSFFFKFFLSVRHELSLLLPESLPALRPDEQELIRPYTQPRHTATHFYQTVSPNQEPIDPVGRPVAHASAIPQVTGEAVYIDDMPRYENELFGGYVVSSKAKAKIVNVDATEALALQGVHLFLSEKDMPGNRNEMPEGYPGQEVFARDEVSRVGQIIGFVAADDRRLARRAAKLVKVSYEETEKPIITIEEAIAAETYRNPLLRTVWRGDAAKAHSGAPHTLEGEIRIGGQEHFYLETHANLAVPGECGSMEVFSSTQDLATLQSSVALALGVPDNKVVCKTKRIGGGFGGKVTNTLCVAVPAAVAANTTGRPVRVVLDRDEDMVMTGTRHPYLGRWKTSFTDEGVLQAVEMDYFSNAGCSLDRSGNIMARSMFCGINAYRCSNVRVTGHVCLTNLTSNTAFRGYGAPQAMLVMEDILDNIASYLNKDSTEIREKNLNSDGDKSILGQVLENCSVRRCFAQVLEQSRYADRKEEVRRYNQSHQHRKRGIVATPVQFGLGLKMMVKEQAGALVMIYKEGSVLLTHGGIEIGQGLHTKMIQVAARVLGVSQEMIHISETSTDKIPNSTTTAASLSSDMYGVAVIRACTVLKDRLAPYRARAPSAGWRSWTSQAYMDRVHLSATGFYATPDISDFNYETQKGNPFSYYTYGSAVTEVEIDCLTGDHTVLRTDIVMDVGDSLNPAIDIGQIEGGFLQGLGLYTLEELRYTPDGTLITKGPGAYKIPGAQDIPCELNVTLLRDSGNPKAVYSSKGIGEPPLLLALSVFFAIKEAVRAARTSDRTFSSTKLLQNGETKPVQNGETKPVQNGEPKRGAQTNMEGYEIPGCEFQNKDSRRFFRLDSPATAERIRMGCQDLITEQIPKPKPGSFTPWDVTV